MTRVRGSRLRISGFVDRVRCGQIPLALAAIGFLLLPVGLQAREPVMAPVSACFVPPENCAAQIVAAIDAATTEIRVQAYAFTSPPILGALASAKRRGLDVQVVLDRSNDHSASEPRYSGATFMANAGVPVWIDTHSGIAHNKLIIIDQHFGGWRLIQLLGRCPGAECRKRHLHRFTGCRELVSCQLDVTA